MSSVLWYTPLEGDNVTEVKKLNDAQQSAISTGRGFLLHASSPVYARGLGARLKAVHGGRLSDINLQKEGLLRKMQKVPGAISAVPVYQAGFVRVQDEAPPAQ
jgi:hypothetical protein